MKLIKENPVEKISVLEVCRHADINRGTFYLHYANISEVLEELEEDCFRRLNSIITELYDARGILQLKKSAPLVNELLHNETIKTLMFHPGVKSNMLEGFRSLVRKKTIDGWTKTGALSPAQADMFFTFLFAGTYAVNQEQIQKNVENSTDDLSFLNDLITRGLYHYLPPKRPGLLLNSPE
ncbi:TetR family transcriptional regulator [Spirochaetia bacterium]|nr:TetR family transcriptional regulator [Spirochaetia bacterium]